MAAKVSIITATFNDGAFIESCADSVLNQEYSQWEWLICDNGSTDNSSSFLAALSDERIKVIRSEENLGVSAGRNMALKQSAGEYICFLDGDDILPKRSVAARMELFDSDNSIEFVDGAVRSFQGNVERIVDSYMPNPIGPLVSDLLSLKGNVFVGNTWMIKCVEGKKYQFDDSISHGEELLFYTSLARSGRYAFTKEEVLYYRRHKNSAMANLVALGNGYLRVYSALKHFEHVSKNDLEQYRVKARSIMVRSFLKRSQPLNALSSFFQFSKI